jgi:hypothetical protein
LLFENHTYTQNTQNCASDFSLDVSEKFNCYRKQTNPIDRGPVVTASFFELLLCGDQSGTRFTAHYGYDATIADEPPFTSTAGRSNSPSFILRSNSRIKPTFRYAIGQGGVLPLPVVFDRPMFSRLFLFQCWLTIYRR